MSLSSALFSGISGLSTLGNSMTVIGDNIANVNTVGFKASRVTFQDVLCQNVATTAGTAQVGRGTSLGDISSSFAQGSFESTDSATDLAISGEGFFVVRDPDKQDNEYYTRAGEFRFDKDGNLVNPAGYIVRGRVLNPDTGEDEGSITDITLSSFTSEPSETNKLTVITNLDSDKDSNSVVLENVWDGSATTTIDDDAYEYQTTLKAYDSLGRTHDITIYYDFDQNTASGDEWEFIITCNPSEDERTGAIGAGKGLLARGKIVFNESSGFISSITLDQFNPNNPSGADDSTGDWTTIADADNWTANSVDTNGYHTFTPEFINGSAMSVQLDFGTRYNGSVWANDSLSTTQYASASTTVFQSADGYGAGDLQSVSVDTDGVITGQYSNGQVLSLYRVALAKFQNIQGLYREGGNLFSETRLSGEAIPGKPGTSGLGNIIPNSLEQSNVDIANEFVTMITTQRGFQANSKIIMVADQMLTEIINLKR